MGSLRCDFKHCCSKSSPGFTTPSFVRENTYTITTENNTRTITEDEIASLTDALLDLRNHGNLGTFYARR